jgi:hypothetical protein
MLFRVFFSIPVTLSFQLVRYIEHLTIAATASAYPLKASARISLALALAHSRNIPAAADACQAALILDPHNESAASLWLLLITVPHSTDETMEVADSLKLQLPASVIVHSVLLVWRYASLHRWTSSTLFTLFALQAVFGLNEKCIMQTSRCRLCARLIRKWPLLRQKHGGGCCCSKEGRIAS